MASVPHRLQEGTYYREAMPLINDNFDKVAQDVNDLGARNTSTSARITATVAAGTTFYKTVAICNPSGSSSYDYVNTTVPITNVSAIVPAIDVYIDTDSDAGYLYPIGTSLSSAQRAMTISAKLDLTKADSNPASITISGRNYDGSSHTYYIYVRCAYFPSAPSGQFR